MCSRSKSRIGLVLSCLVIAFSSDGSSDLSAQDADGNTKHAATESAKLKQTVAEAFRATHDGWSSDEVILNDELYQAFLSRCSSLLPSASEEKFGWTLLNLRKAGKLESKSTRRKQVNVDAVLPVAEIVARSITDQYSVSTDRVMVSPEMRADFDRLAKEIDSEADLYLVRRAAFQLRKTRRLRPELISRIVDWGRKIEIHSAQDVLASPELIPEHPGIYIFQDQSGYLYIGQSENLRERLKSHLTESHSFSLAKYLQQQGADKITIEIHSFAPDSRAKETMIRRAYESELIASRKPRFNIQP